MRILQIGMIVVAALLGGVVGLLVAGNNSDTNDMTDDQFRDRVRQTLIEDPDILRQSFAALEQQTRDAELNELQDAVTRNYSLIDTAPAVFVGGNPDGDVTIIEFSDYECGYCRRALEPFNALVEADGNIRVVYFEFPILGERSYQASIASLAADRQGRYHEFHQLAIAQSGQLTNEVILELAAEAGLDIDQLTEDMNDPELANRVNTNIQFAQAMTVGSTPTYIVGGQVVLGYREDLVTQYIEEARNR